MAAFLTFLISFGILVSYDSLPLSKGKSTGSILRASLRMRVVLNPFLFDYQMSHYHHALTVHPPLLQHHPPKHLFFFLLTYPEFKSHRASSRNRQNVGQISCQSTTYTCTYTPRYTLGVFTSRQLRWSKVSRVGGADPPQAAPSAPPAPRRHTHEAPCLAANRAHYCYSCFCYY